MIMLWCANRKSIAEIGKVATYIELLGKLE